MERLDWEDLSYGSIWLPWKRISYYTVTKIKHEKTPQYNVETDNRRPLDETFCKKMFILNLFYFFIIVIIINYH